MTGGVTTIALRAGSKQHSIRIHCKKLLKEQTRRRLLCDFEFEIGTARWQWQWQACDRDREKGSRPRDKLGAVRLERRGGLK